VEKGSEAQSFDKSGTHIHLMHDLFFQLLHPALQGSTLPPVEAVQKYTGRTLTGESRVA
jgi:hypothetical protein